VEDGRVMQSVLVCEERLAWLAVHFRRAGARVSHGGSALAHGRCVGNSSSTWHATVWLKWNAFLGFLCAELDHEPKSKVVKLGLLYKTNLRFQVIRAMG